MEKDFSPALLAAVRQRPSPLPRVVGLTLAAFLALLIAGASVGRLDIVARADGRLVPESRLQVVQPVEGGRIAAIAVAEGDEVLAGQLLARLDGTVAASELKASRQELHAVRLGLARVRAELTAEPLSSPEAAPADLLRETQAQLAANRAAHGDEIAAQRAELARLRQKRAASVAERERFQAILPLLREDAEAFQELAAAGNARRLVARERERKRRNVARQLATQRERVRGLDAALAQAQHRLEAIRSRRRSQLHTERVELQRRQAELTRAVAQARFRVEHLRLEAPRAGTVQSIATHTLGSVVPAGTTLVTLVPKNEPLQAKLRVRNSDTGFVRAGQTARLKLATYPFQRFGTLDAEVVSVSPTAAKGKKGAAERTPNQTGHYVATLALSRQQLTYEGQTLRFKPGMQVLGEIQLGERTVLEYVLSPIEKVVDYAAKER